jgi:hypothetical protein
VVAAAEFMRVLLAAEEEVAQVRGKSMLGHAD